MVSDVKAEVRPEGERKRLRSFASQDDSVVGGREKEYQQARRTGEERWAS
jgi:hypothetical protein